MPEMETEMEMSDYKSMFEQAVRTLAAIDEALGIGDDGCGQEKNWQTLNQMPDTLRKPLQAQAQRIDDTDCILSGRPWYVGA